MTHPDRYGLVGHPVQHSRSPLIHQIFARQLGENLTYELIDASPEHFETAVRGFGAAGGRGLNVTVPHKEAACALADELGEEAAAARAVNTISFLPDGRLRGDNTDGLGFMRDLTRNLGQLVQQRRVLILGAGGAARGIVGPLLRAAPMEIMLANRTGDRARALVDSFGAPSALGACAFEALAVYKPFDLVVNATSAGLHGELPPFPPSCVGPDSFCYDLSYRLKQDTPFVTWARRPGPRGALQGWGMLVEQAAEAYFIWRGRRPDTAELLKYGRPGSAAAETAHSSGGR